MLNATRTCQGCGTSLPPRHPRAKTRKWCSPQCRAWAARHPGEMRAAWMCGRCGRPLKKSTAKFCARCWDRIRFPRVELTCPICRTVMEASKKRRYCSLTCRNKAKKARIRADPAQYARYLERGRRSDRENQNRLARRADRHQRQRAQEAGLDAVRVDRFAILERDGWRCQVQPCRFRSRKIDPSLRSPHPKSATLDHIVPHSLGGMYAPVNLQAAHRRCNEAKQAGGMDQLRLIG